MTDGAKTESKTGLMAVLRTVAVMEAIAAAPTGISLAKLAPAVGAPKTSLVELLQTLVRANYLRRDGALYRYGPRAFRLAGLIQKDRSFVHEARDYLNQLSRDSDETAVLLTMNPDGRTTVYADSVVGSNPVRYMPVDGEERAAHLTAGGRIMLAYQPADQIEAYLRDVTLESFTADTVASKQGLRKILRDIRAEGFAATYGELVEGGASVAAPVFSAIGQVVAALILGGPAERFRNRADILIGLVKDAAQAMSQRLGYPGEGP
jgi:DNA-binding IclR family transcriptional regulator